MRLMVLNTTQVNAWEAFFVIKICVKILYSQENIDIVSYHENLKGANP